MPFKGIRQMFSTKIILTALAISTAIAACVINARAQEASQVVAIAASVEPSTVKPTYIDVLKSCGAKWKAREDKKSEGNQGAAAWQAFRAMCVKDSGFVTKRSK